MSEAPPTGLGSTAPTTPPPTIPTPPPVDPAKPAVDPAAPAPVDSPADPAKPAEAPKAEEAKPVEAPKPFAATDLKLPEGVTLDEKVSGDFTALLNDEKLSRSELAQRLVDMQIGRERAAAEQGVKAWTDLQESWQKTVREDPEIGGARFDETIGNIGKLLDKYKVDEPTREAFKMTGAGNNPLIVKFLAKVAKDLVEPGPVSGSPGTTPQDFASKLYTTMGNKK